MAQPNVVVHLAGISDLEDTEKEAELASQVNVGATEQIARLCGQFRARLVFLSTDYVFCGDRGRYREDEPPFPMVHYGRTKREAEHAIRRRISACSILRTSLVYGWPQPGGHGNLPAALIQCLETGGIFHGYTDQYRTPTYVGDVVEGIVKCVESDYPGIHHVGGADWVNMYDFARTAAEVFGLDSRRVTPALSPTETHPGPLTQGRSNVDLPSESKEGGLRRPRLLGLDSTQTSIRLGISPRGVVSGLEQMKAERRDYTW